MAKKKSGTFGKLWPWIEPVVALVVGLVSFFPPLNRPDVAIMIWAVGGLFAISSLSTRKQIIAEVTEWFETDMNEIRDTSRILDLYASIQDEDLLQLKQETMSRCVTELENISRGEVPDVRGTPFYMWFIDQFNKAKTSISSVSSMPETNWVEYELERKSLQANYAAAQRGCDAKRIFIVQDQSLLKRPEAREVFFEHLNNGVNPLIALPNQINDSRLWERVKGGFVLIDDRVLLVDTGAPPDTAGRVSKVKAEIAMYRQAFAQLELTSVPALKFLKAFLASECAKLEQEYGTLEGLREEISKTDALSANKLQATADIWKSLVDDQKRLPTAPLEVDTPIRVTS